MTKIQNSKLEFGQRQKTYDLEERTFIFANKCRDFVKKIPKSLSNFEYAKQLIRSSGSVGANYIEANDSISKKDFCHRIKICRKEAKESRYWLRLIDVGDNKELEEEQEELSQEALQLTKIFYSIMEKSKSF
ncbi:MAG: four helix bundle protein [Patescibacteria group bacterium]